MIVISEKELEELKEQIKKEILSENTASQEKYIPLQTAKATWFFGEGRFNKFENSVMENEFGVYRMHRIWDEIRKLTTHIMGKQYFQQLVDCDYEICNMVCDTLCRTVMELRMSEDVQSQLNKKDI